MNDRYRDILSTYSRCRDIRLVLSCVICNIVNVNTNSHSARGTDCGIHDSNGTAWHGVKNGGFFFQDHKTQKQKLAHLTRFWSRLGYRHSVPSLLLFAKEWKYWAVRAPLHVPCRFVWPKLDRKSTQLITRFVSYQRRKLRSMIERPSVLAIVRQEGICTHRYRQHPAIGFISIQTGEPRIPVGHKNGFTCTRLLHLSKFNDRLLSNLWVSLIIHL